MKYFLIIITMGLTTSCISNYKGVQLSTVTVNSKKANYLIVNRFPDYGDGHKDGCIVMSELRLDLTTNKSDQTVGKITDVSTGLPLYNAQITIRDNLEQSYILLSDSSGYFKATTKGKLTDLQINYLGYRQLTLKF